MCIRDSRCLASLEKYAPESEIILVDDASGLAETLQAILHFSARNGWKVAVSYTHLDVYKRQALGRAAVF